MIFSLLTSLSCFVPICLILIVYLFQNRKSDISSGLFISFLISIFIIVISETLSTYFLNYGLILAAKVFLRIHWLCTIVFIVELTLYNNFSLHHDRYNDAKFLNLLKERNILKIYFVIAFLTTVGFMLNKFDISPGVVEFIPGAPAYIVYIFMIISIFFMLADVLSVKSKTKNNRLSIFNMILLAMYLLFQFASRTVAYDVLFFALIILITYIIRENPDVYASMEYENVQSNINAINANFDLTLKNIKNCNKSTIDKIVALTTEYESEEVTLEKCMIDVDNIFDMVGGNLVEMNNNLISLMELTSVKEIKMNDIISKFYKYAKVKADKSNIDLKFSIGENVASSVKCNSDSLYYLFISIFNAALDDTEDGIIDMSINGFLDVDGYHFHITCEDTGNGKTQKECDQLIKALSDNINLHKINPNYIMMKRHLEKLDGTFKLSGDKHVGTLIEISMPLERTVDKNEPSITLGNAAFNIPDAIDMSGTKILFVSDDDGMLRYYKDLFDLFNIDAVCAKGSLEGLNHIKREEEFDFVFVDVFMENFNGFAFGDALKTLAIKYDYEVPVSVAVIPYLSLKKADLVRKNLFKKSIMAPLTIDELNRFFRK